jgi:hypothetical protein
MDLIWQQLVVGLAVAAALAYVAWCVWRLVRGFAGHTSGGGCGSCSKCPATSVGKELPLVSLEMNAAQPGTPAATGPNPLNPTPRARV